MTSATATPLPTAPRLAFRVGVTGAREPLALIEQLRPRVEDVLRQISAEMTHLCDRSDVKEAYRQDQPGRIEPTLTLLSPLAMGADRLVARVAIETGYKLHVPMPFARAEYEQDFRHIPGAIAEMQKLLDDGKAEVLELDGADDQPAARLYHRSRAYEAVGRYVVHNCDLLIAIWDGTPPKGRGGTFDTVRHALDHGVPVWWIDATDPTRNPTWLSDVIEPRREPASRTACAELTDYMRRLIPPPRPPHGHSHGIIESLVRLLPGRRTEPHLEYLNTRPSSAHWWSRAHAGFLWLLASEAAVPETSRTPKLPTACYWNKYRNESGSISSEMGDRYRSSYVWVFTLVSLSISLAAFELAFKNTPAIKSVVAPVIYLEAIALLLILLVVACNIRLSWHQRWIDTRLLSELCRTQEVLSTIGWSLPGRAISRLVEERIDPRQRDRAAWVPWFFAALLRAAPLPTQPITAETLKEPLRMARDDLVRGQQDYHVRRHRRYHKASNRLVLTGELIFLTVAILVGIKIARQLDCIGPGLDGWMSLAKFLLIFLPTIGAASVGIRAYAELEMMTEQSRHMEQIMLRATAALTRLEPKLHEPLASQDLGAILHSVTTNMLQDIDGWARMFRVKVIDAG